MSLHLIRPAILLGQDISAVRNSLLCVARSRGSRQCWRRSLGNSTIAFQNQSPPQRNSTSTHQTSDGLTSSAIDENDRSKPTSPQTPQMPISENDDHSVPSFSKDLTTEKVEDSAPTLRRPRALQAIFLRPLKRKAQFGVPTCDLQLRSYGPRNVEFFADFAMRAAYYLGLPASGPAPLPRITERWTVPRDSFIFKKSQENFERITYRRLIQIQDANTEVVEIWLAFLRKHAYYGIGMKANVWQYEKLGVGKTMDVNLENLRSSLDPAWAHFGRRKTLETSEKAYQMIKDENFETASNKLDVAAA